MDFSTLPQFPVPTDRGSSPRQAAAWTPLQRLLRAAAVACVALVAVSFWCVRPWDPISPFTYFWIRPGMSEGAVESLIGLSPGTHQTVRRLGGIGTPGNFGSLIAESGLPE